MSLAKTLCYYRVMASLRRLGRRGSYHDPVGVFLLIAGMGAMMAAAVLGAFAPFFLWALIIWGVFSIIMPENAPSPGAALLLLALGLSGLFPCVIDGRTPSRRELVSYLTFGN